MDVDFLLDEEKKKIEQDISEKYIPAENQPEPEKDKGEANEMPIEKKKKFEIIEDFMLLQQERGEIEFTEAKLKRMTKAEIIKHIANFMNKEIAGTPAISENSEVEQPKYELDPEKLNLAAEGIFMLNLALVSTFETVSIKLKDKTSGIALLENWTKKVNDRKKDLLIIFALMYKDYKAEFDKYLSPVVQYAILMLQTGTQCAIENYTKKKEHLTDSQN